MKGTTSQTTIAQEDSVLHAGAAWHVSLLLTPVGEH